MRSLPAAALVLTLALVGGAQSGSKKQIETPAFDKVMAQQMIDNSIQRFEIAEAIRSSVPSARLVSHFYYTLPLHLLHSGHPCEMSARQDPQRMAGRF